MQAFGLRFQKALLGVLIAVSRAYLEGLAFFGTCLTVHCKILARMITHFDHSLEEVLTHIIVVSILFSIIPI